LKYRKNRTGRPKMISTPFSVRFLDRRFLMPLSKATNVLTFIYPSHAAIFGIEDAYQGISPVCLRVSPYSQRTTKRID